MRSGSANCYRQKEKERLQNNSECTVFGKGGDELKLAALSSFDETRYNEWLATIIDNPKTVEFHACGIRTLLDDETQSQSLRTAFTETTIFTLLKAVFNFDRQLHIFRGDQYILITHQILAPGCLAEDTANPSMEAF